MRFWAANDTIFRVFLSLIRLFRYYYFVVYLCGDYESFKTKDDSRGVIYSKLAIQASKPNSQWTTNYDWSSALVQTVHFYPNFWIMNLHTLSVLNNWWPFLTFILTKNTSMDQWSIEFFTGLTFLVHFLALVITRHCQSSIFSFVHKSVLLGQQSRNTTDSKTSSTQQVLHSINYTT